MRKRPRYLDRLLSFIRANDAPDPHLAALQTENAALRIQIAELSRLHRTDVALKAEAASHYRSREALVLIPQLMPLLPPQERFVIVDGGAREVDRDARWKPFPAGLLHFVGFEPDAAEAARLNAGQPADGSRMTFIPAGLWGSSGTLTFEHNNIGGGSSFMPQNRDVTDRWKFENPNETALARDIFFPVRQEDLAVITLADWMKTADVTSVDFIKLNVQGGELEILQGAGAALDGVLGLLVEVAFVESYRDRPMFSDIDIFLRRRGFQFFDLLAHHYVGRAAAPVAAQHLAVVEPKLGQLVSAWGQLIEGHALYFRDPVQQPSSMTTQPTALLKLAMLAEAWGQIEYAFEVLEWLLERPGIADSDLGRGVRHAIQRGAMEYERLSRHPSAS